MTIVQWTTRDLNRMKTTASDSGQPTAQEQSPKEGAASEATLSLPPGCPWTMHHGVGTQAESDNLAELRGHEARVHPPPKIARTYGSECLRGRSYPVARYISNAGKGLM